MEVIAVSKVCEKIDIYCPAEEASELLEHFIAMRAPFATGKKIPLRASLDVAGLHLDFQQDVNLVASREKATGIVTLVNVAWEPVEIGRFPAFEGTLEIEPERHQNICSIALRGSYRPPFGLIGKAFDEVLGGQIARTTVCELLSRIRAYIEVAYRSAERESSRVPSP